MMRPRPPSGHTIVTELLTEMEERLYPMLYRTLPPSVYHVYLHPDDFRDLEAVTSLIVAEAVQGLNARVESLNRRSLLSRLTSGRQPTIEVPSSGWEITIHPDANGELERGQLGIESRLSVPTPPRYEGGTPTARIGRTVVTGSIRRSLPSAESSAPEPVAAATAAAGPHAVVAERGHAASLPRSTSGTGRLAKLAYTDDEGRHEFVMRKDLISIGRGGSAHWVDVQVVTNARVSREHCRIRKAPDGRFFLQDVSSWGTSVDGTRVPPFARQTGGRVEETGHEHELPRHSRIQLADGVVIDFSADP
jgi:hypothetical protein